MEKKFRVVRFVPVVIVEHNSYGFRSLETSSCLYEDMQSARDCLDSLIKTWNSFEDSKVIRSSIIRKVFEL